MNKKLFSEPMNDEEGVKIPLRVSIAKHSPKKEESLPSFIRRCLSCLAVFILIISLNWFSLSSIGETFGLFGDTENSSPNEFVAGVLDFELESFGDFAPVCSVGVTPAERTISILNNGNLFKYIASSTEFSSDVCNYVNLEANLDGGDPEYIGPLKDFQTEISEFSEPGSWNFKLFFSSDLPEGLEGQTCTFKFVFSGSQTKNDLSFGRGFSDTEEITNNITAPVCHYGETRTIGYWKNHSSVYAPHLPQFLGGYPSDEIISSTSDVDAIFDADNSVMRNKLKKQLLAMKFNIAHFGVAGYFVESEGKILNEIVAEADSLLRQEPPPVDSVLEEMKDLLDYWNQDRQLHICSCGQGGPQEPYLVINKVYYDVDDKHGSEPANEWVELYNPTEFAMDITNWIIADNHNSDILASTSPIIIPALGFAIVTASSTTWNYWEIPPEVVKIVLADGRIGNGLANAGDRVILKDAAGMEVDAVSWGDDIYAFDPSVADVEEGHMIGRYPSGFDTDTASDWLDFTPPDLTIIYPLGGETWYVGHTYNIQWTAENNNGDDDELSVDIYYSRDSGLTWAPIIEDTENDGSYQWYVSLFLEPGHYYVPSSHSRIKIVASGPENFMVQARVSSDDFCPPIDYDALSTEDQALVDQLILEGLIDESEVVRGGVEIEEEPLENIEETAQEPASDQRTETIDSGAGSSCDNNSGDDLCCSVEEENENIDSNGNFDSGEQTGRGKTADETQAEGTQEEALTEIETPSETKTPTEQEGEQAEIIKQLTAEEAIKSEQIPAGETMDSEQETAAIETAPIAIEPESATVPSSDSGSQTDGGQARSGIDSISAGPSEAVPTD